MRKTLLDPALLIVVTFLATGCAAPTVRVHNQTGHPVVFELAMPSQRGLIGHSPNPWRYEVMLPGGETWPSSGSERYRALDYDWAWFSTGFQLRIRRIREVSTDRRGWVHFRIDRAGSATITIRFESDEFLIVAKDEKGMQLKVRELADNELGNNRLK